MVAITSEAPSTTLKIDVLIILGLDGLKYSDTGRPFTLNNLRAAAVTNNLPIVADSFLADLFKCHIYQPLHLGPDDSCNLSGKEARGFRGFLLAKHTGGRACATIFRARMAQGRFSGCGR
jgi:hypothetical protein